METSVTDFYVGFEGEPEVTLVRVGSETHSLHAWNGYFSQVLDAIEPGSDGEWHGLALHYQLETGWYDVEEFEVEDVPLFASQLSALNKYGFEPATRRFYESLSSFVQAATSHNDKLLISYF